MASDEMNVEAASEPSLYSIEKAVAASTSRRRFTNSSRQPGNVV
jgi:hypothetical protein